MSRLVKPDPRPLDAVHVLVDDPYVVARLVVTAPDGTVIVGDLELDRLVDLQARLRSAQLVLEHAGPFVDLADVARHPAAPRTPIRRPS